MNATRNLFNTCTRNVFATASKPFLKHRFSICERKRPENAVGIMTQKKIEIGNSLKENIFRFSVRPYADLFAFVPLAKGAASRHLRFLGATTTQKFFQCGGLSNVIAKIP